MDPTQITHLKQLVAQGKSKEAINYLVENIAVVGRASLHNEILHFSARWNDYESGVRMGLLSEAEANLNRRQIDNALLQLIDKLGEKEAVFKIKSDKKKLRNILITITALLAVLAGLAEITGINLMSFGRKNPVAVDTNATTTGIDTSTKQISSIPTNAAEQEETQNKPTHNATQPVIDKQENTDKGIPMDNAITLMVRCKTNKGRDNLSFASGETLRLFFQVNKPCKLRVIYKLADERLVLLDNDREVSNSEIGRDLVLGDFDVSEPYGEERLYVFAQSENFPPLRTETTEDGYTLILDGLPDALHKTRGLKKKTYYAEDSLIVNTKPE